MIKWEEQFDKIFNSVLGVKHFHPEIEDEIKLFISNLIEQVIDGLPYDEFEFENMETLKQQLRKRWL